MGVLTRTRARVVLTVLKMCFAEEASTASLFKILILSFRSDTLALRARVSIFAGLVKGVLRGWWRLNSGGARRLTRGLHAPIYPRSGP